MSGGVSWLYLLVGASFGGALTKPGRRRRSLASLPAPEQVAPEKTGDTWQSPPVSPRRHPDLFLPASGPGLGLPSRCWGRPARRGWCWPRCSQGPPLSQPPSLSVACRHTCPPITYTASAQMTVPPSLKRWSPGLPPALFCTPSKLPSVVPPEPLDRQASAGPRSQPFAVWTDSFLGSLHSSEDTKCRPSPATSHVYLPAWALLVNSRLPHSVACPTARPLPSHGRFRLDIS